MFDKLIYFVFNTFYRDGKSTDNPVWMRMYLILLVASAAFTYNIIVFISKILYEGISGKAGKSLLWALAGFYGIAYYVLVIRNNYYMDVYKRLSFQFKDVDQRPFYIITWGLILLATYGFLIFLAKGRGSSLNNSSCRKEWPEYRVESKVAVIATIEPMSRNSCEIKTWVCTIREDLLEKPANSSYLCTTMSSEKAIKILLSILVAVIIFHLLIIIKVIPYTITWGGRLKNDEEMYLFEFASIAINLLLGAILLYKAKLHKSGTTSLLVNGLLWVFLGIFILNTVGNLFAKTVFEKSFSLLTLILAILIGIVLRSHTTLVKAGENCAVPGDGAGKPN